MRSIRGKSLEGLIEKVNQNGVIYLVSSFSGSGMASSGWVGAGVKEDLLGRLLGSVML